MRASDYLIVMSCKVISGVALRRMAYNVFPPRRCRARDLHLIPALPFYAMTAFQDASMQPRQLSRLEKRPTANIHAMQQRFRHRADVVDLVAFLPPVLRVLPPLMAHGRGHGRIETGDTARDPVIAGISAPSIASHSENLPHP